MHIVSHLRDVPDSIHPISGIRSNFHDSYTYLVLNTGRYIVVSRINHYKMSCRNIPEFDLLLDNHSYLMHYSLTFQVCRAIFLLCSEMGHFVPVLYSLRMEVGPCRS